MRLVVGGVGALLVHAVTVARDLGGTGLADAAFGSFGAPVSSAGSALQRQHVQALDALLTGLQRVNGHVRRVADAYEDTDGAVARAFDSAREPAAPAVAAPAAPPTGGLLAGLWGSGVGTAVADTARRDLGAGEPAAVGHVVGYLRAAGVGRVGEAPLPTDAFDGPTSFADWLDRDPAHQTHVGVIHVYRGDVRALADIPGGVREGDVVVVDPDLMGVATGPGAPPPLVNHGPVTAVLDRTSPVRIYRPL